VSRSGKSLDQPGGWTIALVISDGLDGSRTDDEGGDPNKAAARRRDFVMTG